MKYIFKKGETVGEYPVECFQVCYYDGTVIRDNGCFDESFIEPKRFDYRYITYIETDEDRKEQGVDHHRVFAIMKNGDIYELQLKKIDPDEDLSFLQGTKKNASG